MATEADRIRSGIEATRRELASDVDRLADRASPRRMAQRRWSSVKSRTRTMKARVMGVSEQAGGGISGASGVSETVRGAPETLTRQAQGNPLAAGIIAFGAGLLTASLIPETEAERRLAREVSDRSGELAGPLREAGQQIGQDVGRTVKEAAGQVTETAKEAASGTAQQARQAARG